MTGTRWWVALGVLLAALSIECLFPKVEKSASPPRFQEFPYALGRWQARDSSIDQHLVAVSQVDAYMSRIYRQEPAEEIALYVGYYKSQRAGDSIHSPKNCLPGAGWEQVRSTRIQLGARGNLPGEANLYIVENHHRRFVVLYWYHSHGRVIASEFQAKYYTFRDAMLLHRTDSALVRITVPVVDNEAQSIGSATAFAKLIEPEIDEILPR